MNSFTLETESELETKSIKLVEKHSTILILFAQQSHIDDPVRSFLPEITGVNRTGRWSYKSSTDFNSGHIYSIQQNKVQSEAFFMSGTSDWLCEIKRVHKIFDQWSSLTAYMDVKITIKSWSYRKISPIIKSVKSIIQSLLYFLVQSKGGDNLHHMKFQTWVEGSRNSLIVKTGF